MKVAVPIGILEGPVRGIGEDLERVCREREARGIVLGLPRHMDGREGDLAPKVRRLARRLRRRLSVPIWLWDERLTTAEVERRSREAGGGSRHKDDLAATLILQGFLDAEAWTREPFLGDSKDETEDLPE
jgi:putative Holliday junction resolvase